MRPLYGCLTAVLTLSLAACTPTPVNTPTPVPTTYQCTPEAGGDPYTCNEAQHQEMLKKDALYAEAERAYRAFHEEQVRLYRLAAPASPELLDMMEGEIASVITSTHTPDAKLVGGEYKIIWVKRLVGVSSHGSIVALESCTDASTVEVIRDGKSLGSGRKAVEQTFFGGDPESLKVVWAEFSGVEQC